MITADQVKATLRTIPGFGRGKRQQRQMAVPLPASV
jgi:hypothetical protein